MQGHLQVQLKHSDASIIFFQRVLLFICHGVGEHMGRYNKLATHLAEEGVLVYGHDHGRSPLMLGVLFMLCRDAMHAVWNS